MAAEGARGRSAKRLRSSCCKNRDRERMIEREKMGKREKKKAH
jgi:hypothetical protein